MKKFKDYNKLQQYLLSKYKDVKFSEFKKTYNGKLGGHDIKEVAKECDSMAKLRMNNAKKMMKNKCFTERSMQMGLDGIMAYISECEKEKQLDILEHTDNWIHEIKQLTPSEEIKDILLDMYKKKSACFT